MRTTRSQRAYGAVLAARCDRDAPAALDAVRVAARQQQPAAGCAGRHRDERDRACQGELSLEAPTGRLLGMPVYLDPNIPTTGGRGTEDPRLHRPAAHRSPGCCTARSGSAASPFQREFAAHLTRCASVKGLHLVCLSSCTPTIRDVHRFDVVLPLGRSPSLVEHRHTAVM
jgi:hypothetical protein